jgi:hypothetical protein
MAAKATLRTAVPSVCTRLGETEQHKDRCDEKATSERVSRPRRKHASASDGCREQQSSDQREHSVGRVDGAEIVEDGVGVPRTGDQGIQNRGGKADEGEPVHEGAQQAEPAPLRVLHAVKADDEERDQRLGDVRDDQLTGRQSSGGELHHVRCDVKQRRDDRAEADQNRLAGEY